MVTASEAPGLSLRATVMASRGPRLSMQGHDHGQWGPWAVPQGHGHGQRGPWAVPQGHGHGQQGPWAVPDTQARRGDVVAGVARSEPRSPTPTTHRVSRSVSAVCRKASRRVGSAPVWF